MKECYFCEITNKKEIKNLIEENKYAIAIAGDYYREGHCSIILKRHITSISELNLEEFNNVFQLIKKISKAQEIKYQASKTYLLAIGDMIEHLHFHLIPKHKDKCSMGVYSFGKLFEAEGERKPTENDQIKLKNEIKEIISRF